jgi:hypothetical protein
MTAALESRKWCQINAAEPLGHPHRAPSLSQTNEAESAIGFSPGLVANRTRDAAAFSSCRIFTAGTVSDTSRPIPFDLQHSHSPVLVDF